MFSTKLELVNYQKAKRPHLFESPFESLSYRDMLLAFQLSLTEKLYEGAPHVWTNFLSPVELFYSSGFVPLVLETEGALLARTGEAQRFIEAGTSFTQAVDLCSYQKAVLGAFLEGFLPPPALVVCTSHPCESAGKLGELLARHFRVPFYLIDVPYLCDKLSTVYLQNQFERLFDILLAWQSMNRVDAADRLKKALLLSNQARNYHLKANELRRSGKPLISGRECLGIFATAVLALGTEKGVLIYRRFLEELLEKKRIQETDAVRCGGKGEDGAPVRVYWLHFKPFYDDSLLKHLEENLHVPIVFEGVNHVFWPPHNPERPFESLATRVLSFTLNGPIARRISIMLENIRDYNITGVINFLHQGCRQYNSGSRLVKDALNALDIPYLELNSDCVDASFYNVEQLRTRIEAFAELLLSGKKR